MKRIASALPRAFVVLLLLTAPGVIGAQTLDALATKGEAIANADPLAAELRNREPTGPSRRGFDIGIAAAEGQTSPGPGKQRIHDSLNPAEQAGFDSAVSFSLERNRNADLAATGAAIAKMDPTVAEARTVETDVFYWLGFDIATGIFGNPAQGARGNTATGPGSLKIRDSLSPAGQRGFNASMALHLGRHKPTSKIQSHPPVTTRKILPLRVPNVVGLSLQDAMNGLALKGFKPRYTLQDEPDPSVRYGHVRATVPAAGMLAAGGEVELQIPRAASTVAIGALSLSDLERRDGFDLDEGHYEETLRGADIVLRKYNNEPRVDANGRTYYAGAAVAIEPSDGAVLAWLSDGRSIDESGLGSFFFFDACESAMKLYRTKSYDILDHNDGLATICVLTSKHQLAVVQFWKRDNPGVDVTDFKFHYALFPRQMFGSVSPFVEENSDVRVIPKKP